MEITIKKLKDIYESEDNFMVFIKKYDNTNIEFKKTESSGKDDDVMLIALNEACKKIADILSAKEIGLLTSDIYDIISARAVKGNQYPNGLIKDQDKIDIQEHGI